jgi:hypothetical protein
MPYAPMFGAARKAETDETDETLTIAPPCSPSQRPCACCTQPSAATTFVSSVLRSVEVDLDQGA